MARQGADLLYRALLNRIPRALLFKPSADVDAAFLLEEAVRQIIEQGQEAAAAAMEAMEAETATGFAQERGRARAEVESADDAPVNLVLAPQQVLGVLAALEKHALMDRSLWRAVRSAGAECLRRDPDAWTAEQLVSTAEVLGRARDYVSLQSRVRAAAALLTRLSCGCSCGRLWLWLQLRLRLVPAFAGATVAGRLPLARSHLLPPIRMRTG